jgi:hypothetical protein
MADSKINISQAKKIRRDICRTTDHEWKELKRSFPEYNTECTRCKKRVWSAWGSRITIPTAPISSGPKVKYADLRTKKFNVLDRARKRASDSDKT